MGKRELLFCVLTHSKASFYQTNQITNSPLSFGQKKEAVMKKILSLSQESDI